MMKRIQDKPEINAGSMADIAFLLLIFFLVTTTIESEQGLLIKLPKYVDDNNVFAPHYDRNVLEINLNAENKIMIEGKISSIDQLKPIAISFLDNNGNGSCLYCNGIGSATKSDHPHKAIISLFSHRSSSYEQYINVYNEIIAAYTSLRNKQAMQLYQVLYSDLNSVQKNKVKHQYPLQLSEAEPFERK